MCCKQICCHGWFLLLFCFWTLLPLSPLECWQIQTCATVPSRVMSIMIVSVLKFRVWLLEKAVITFIKCEQKPNHLHFLKKNLENLFCHLDSSKLWYLCYNSDQVRIIPSNFELRTVWAVRGQSECHVDHTSHVSHRCAYRSKNTALLRKATPSSVPSVKQRTEEHNPCEDIMDTALTIAFAHFPLLWENLPNDRWLINGKSPTFPDSEDHVH